MLYGMRSCVFPNNKEQKREDERKSISVVDAGNNDIHQQNSKQKSVS